MIKTILLDKHEQVPDTGVETRLSNDEQAVQSVDKGPLHLKQE
jgi:hypothetical protein